MISASELGNYVQAVPFRPFRITMNSGKVYDIRHPEMIKVGKREFLYFTYVSESRAIHDRWEMVSLTLVESVSFLEVQAA